MTQEFIPGFGAALAAAREAKGLTTAEVAERLKLTSRQIEALEAEDWPHLPDAVFVRGFLRNYAKLVDLELDALIRPVAPIETATQTITAPSAGVRLGKSPVARWLLLPLLLAAVFVAVVAGLYTWLSQGEDTLVSSVALPQATQPASTVAPPPPAGSGVVVQPLPIQPQAQATPTPPPPAAAADKPARAAEATPAATPPPATRSPVAQPTATPSPEPVRTGGATMKFQPQEDAWIQVVDGKGMRFSKLVRAGASEVVAGTPPFRLVVGNAANVTLTYNGHTIDLTPFIGERVARLTLE